MRAVFTFALLFVSAALFAACASNGARSFVPGGLDAPAAAGVDGAVTTVTVKITVAAKNLVAESEERRPRYFSRSSKGLLVQAYAHGKNKVAATLAVNIAPGSKACGGSKASPRTCAATFTIPSTIARADFRISAFNVKPVRNAIPKTAHLLAFGMLADKKISAKKTNAFTVYLGGVVDGLSGNPGFVSLPGDGAAHSVAVMIDPVDFGNNPITGGGKDPFANPIVVSLLETGGTGHALLSLNGGAGSARVTVSRSTDAVSLDYDGGGSIGYGATVKLTAPTLKGGGGATEQIAVSPLLLASSRGDYTPALLALKGNGEFQTVSIGELAAPAATAYTLATTKCNAIESTMPLVQSSATSASFRVITRSIIATPNPAGCAIAVSDGTSTIHVEVSNSYSGVLGAPTIATTPIPSGSAGPIEMTVGPDGAMWFAEVSTGKIGRIATGPIGTNGAISEVTLPVASFTPKPSGLTTGPDGNLWFTDCSSNTTVGKLTTAGVVTAIPVTLPSSQPSFIVAGSDGAMWFSFYSAAGVGTVPTSGGSPAYHSTGFTGTRTATIALAADGNLWFTENDANVIGKIAPSGAVTEFAIPHANAAPWGITAGPDGALWFTECTGG
ncbi:MAG TPA: hypothetical protein VK760_10375, partial [Candidatus Acidoferrales bacterium]|nr:hypothetical protein [Candidatus Acidoferrales bacterium]